MVEEAIRGTSTLDRILTKKKNTVGEMETDRNIQRELLRHSRVQGNQRGGGRLGKLIGKRQDSMARDVAWKMTQEDRTAFKYSIVIIMTKKKNLSGRAEGGTEANTVASQRWSPGQFLKGMQTKQKVKRGHVMDCQKWNGFRRTTPGELKFQICKAWPNK